MSDYELIKDAHVGVTSAGAFYACSGRELTAARKFMFALLDCAASPTLSTDKVCQWADTDNPAEAMELLYRLQSMGWIRDVREAEPAPDAHLERAVPKLLEELSADGRAMLADSQGFFLAASGFPHETAEALAALSADIAALATRHEGLVRENLGIDSAAWSVVDAAGNSRIGFWPLFLGTQTFVLALAGEPCLHRDSFAQLVWGLTRRYAGERDHFDLAHRGQRHAVL